jgi:hypothetical protein
MKKLIFTFFLSLMIVSFSFGQAVIFADYFDTYTAGQKLACQNPTAWTTWSNAPCGGEDALISSTYSSSPSNSVVLTHNIDVVKTIPNYTSGIYTIHFKMYIPTGKWGYFNVLQLFAGSGSSWGMQSYFEANGSARVDAGGANAASFTYPYNQWNDVRVNVNLNSNTAIYYFNNNQIVSWVWSSGAFGQNNLNQLGGVNLFGATASDEMYVDNFIIVDEILPVELTSFTSMITPAGIQLNWTTATEINNRGFEIERKADEGDFTLIGFVAGNGTTTETQEYTFTDNISAPGNYIYRLKQLDFDGRFEYSSEIEVEFAGMLSFALSSNYPNPFNPSTKINYSIAEAGFVKLSVYNLLGQEVAVLVNDVKNAGSYEVSFDASNLSSGTYIYKLASGSKVEVKKMILTK